MGACSGGELYAVFRGLDGDRLDCVGFEAFVARLGLGFGVILRVGGCSAERLRFRASMRLMAFCQDGADATLGVGTWASFSRSFSTRSPGTPLLAVGVRDLAHQLGPIHLDCSVDRASLRPSVIF